MVKIVIENLGGKELKAGDNSKTALEHFHEQYIDWMHACGGKGRCTTCKMIVLEGKEHLGQLTEAEIRYKNQGLLKENERLACQATVFSNISVRVPHEYKMPHLRYTD